MSRLLQCQHSCSHLCAHGSQIMPGRARKSSAGIHPRNADLVDGDSVLIIHLVELINEADTLVSQHQRATFQRPLPGHRILLHCCCQTYCAGPLACIGNDLTQPSFADTLSTEPSAPHAKEQGRAYRSLHIHDLKSEALDLRSSSVSIAILHSPRLDVTPHLWCRQSAAQSSRCTSGTATWRSQGHPAAAC